MANTNINIRMDADLKRQFEAFCADMGMTMTTAFNVFARKAVREYRIPFEISGLAYLVLVVLLHMELMLTKRL